MKQTVLSDWGISSWEHLLQTWLDKGYRIVPGTICITPINDTHYCVCVIEKPAA